MRKEWERPHYYHVICYDLINEKIEDQEKSTKA